MIGKDPNARPAGSRRLTNLRGLVQAPRGVSEVVPEALAFLDPIERICEQDAPRVLRLTHVLIVVLFAALLLVAGLVKIDIVATGMGRLTTETAPIVLQPMERAILREIDVRPGDAVTKGQTLATLDPTFARADQVAAAEQLRALRTQLRRLTSEAAGETFVTPRQADADETLQASLWRQRQAEFAAHLLVFDEDIERLQATLRTAQDDQSSLARQLDIGRAVETMRETLLAHQTGSRLQFLEAQAARLRTERELLEAGNRLADAQHGLMSKSAERDAFVDGWHRELSQDLVSTRAEIARLTEVAAKASRLADLLVVTAPEDGVVLEVAQRSAGSVLREAEPLLTITPSHGVLIAEITIGSRDVGYLVPGMPAEIKIDAFPYQRHGVLKARLLSIGEESFQAGTGAINPDALHRARLELEATTLQNIPPGAHVYPGMTLTAEIRIGARSALSYFLTPITRGLQESLREP